MDGRHLSEQLASGPGVLRREGLAADAVHSLASALVQRGGAVQRPRHFADGPEDRLDRVGGSVPRSGRPSAAGRYHCRRPRFRFPVQRSLARSIPNHAGRCCSRLWRSPEHEHYARVILRVLREALPTLPSGLGLTRTPSSPLRIVFRLERQRVLRAGDDRLARFRDAALRGNFVDYLVSHEALPPVVVQRHRYQRLLPRPSWTKALAVYFSHRLHGREVRPKQLADLAAGSSSGSPTFVARLPLLRHGHAGPRRMGAAPCRTMPRFENLVLFMAMTYDRAARSSA